MRRRGRVIISVVVAFGLLGGGVASAFQVRKNIQDADNAHQLAVKCHEINDKIKAQGSPMVNIGDGGRSVDILGDSYAAGDYLGNAADSWVHRLAALEDLTAHVDAIGGTGFTNGGPCGVQAFSARVDEVLATKPQVVIIEGGLNDHAADQHAFERSASALMDKFSEVKTVVVIGPTHAPAVDGCDKIDAALRSAAESKGRQYVSAYAWKLDFAQDGIHLTPGGHAAYADHVAAAARL